LNFKLGIVSYLNTKPFLYGLEQSDLRDQIELSIDIPSVCAEKLLKGEIDLGLAPAAIIPLLKEYYIVSDYCISADGKVETVCLFAQCPVEEVKTIYLDYQSRTSVELVKILIKDCWKINPTLIPAKQGYEPLIKDQTAGLIIGDRAIANKGKFRYEYDLAEAWKNYTNLPFVFALWISNKKLPDIFIHQFDKSLQYGIEHIHQIVESCQPDYPHFDVKKYLTQYVNYKLDTEKQKGLDLFLKKIGSC